MSDLYSMLENAGVQPMGDEDLAELKKSQKVEQMPKAKTLKAVAEKKEEEKSWVNLDMVTAPVVATMEAAGKTVHATADSAGYLYYQGKELAANAGIAVSNLMSKTKTNYVDYSKDYSAFEKVVRDNEKAMSGGAEQLQSDIASKINIGTNQQSKIGDAINSRATAETVSMIYEYINAASLTKKAVMKGAKALGKTPNLNTFKANAALVAPTLAVKQTIFNDADQKTLGNVVDDAHTYMQDVRDGKVSQEEQDGIGHSILNSLDKISRDSLLGNILEAVSIDEDDTAFEKRLKQVGAELPLGIAFEAVMPLGKMLFNSFKGRKATPQSLDEVIEEVESVGLPNENNVLLKSIQQNLKDSGIEKSLDDLVKTADELEIPIVKSNGDVNADMIDEFTTFYKEAFKQVDETVEAASAASRSRAEPIPVNKEELSTSIEAVATSLKSAVVNSDEALATVKSTLESVGVNVDDSVIKSVLDDVANAEPKDIASRIVSALDEFNPAPVVDAQPKATLSETLANIVNKYKGKTQAEVIAETSSLKNKLVTNPYLMEKIAGVVKRTVREQDRVGGPLAPKELKLSAKDKKIASDINNTPPITRSIAELLDGMNDGKTFAQSSPSDFKSVYAILDNAQSVDEFERNFANAIYGEVFEKTHQSNAATLAKADLLDKAKAYNIKDAANLQVRIKDLPVELVRLKRMQQIYNLKSIDSAKELHKINTAIAQANKTGKFDYENLTLVEANNFKIALQAQFERDFKAFTYAIDLGSDVVSNVGRGMQIMNRSVDVTASGTIQKQYIKELSKDFDSESIDIFASRIADDSIRSGNDILETIRIAQASKFDKSVDVIMYVRQAGLLSSFKSLAVNTYSGLGMLVKDPLVGYTAVGVKQVSNGIRRTINSTFGTKMKIDENGITLGEVNLKNRAKLEAIGDLFTGIKQVIPKSFDELKAFKTSDARDNVAAVVAGTDDVKNYVREGLGQDLLTGTRNGTLNGTPFDNIIISPRNAEERVLKSFLSYLGKTIGLPIETMKATDQLIYGVQLRAELYAKAYRQVHKELAEGTLKQEELAGRLNWYKENPTDEMRVAAYNDAKKVTFAQDLQPVGADGLNTSGLVGNVGNAISEFRNKNPIIGKTAVPFIKVPTNITIETLESTPLGLFPGLTRTRADLVRILKEGGEESQVLVSKMILGTSLIGYGMSLYSDGNLSADDGRGKAMFANSDEMKELGIPSKTKTGVKSYSLKMPFTDTYYHIARESTLGTFLQIGAQAQYALDRGLSKKEVDNSVITGLLAGYKVLGDKSFAQGLVDFIEAVSENQKGNGNLFMKYAANQASTFIPYSALQRDINMAMSPELAEFHDFWDKSKAKTLGKKEDLYFKRDIITGEVLKNQHFTMYNPFEASEQSDSGLVRHLDDIGYVPKAIPKNINGIILNGEQYDKLQQYITKNEIDGKNLKATLMELVNSDEYAELPNGDVYNYDGSNLSKETGADFNAIKRTKQGEIDRMFRIYRAQGEKEFMLNEPIGKDLFVNKKLPDVLSEFNMDHQQAKRYLESEFLEMVKEYQGQ